MMTRDSLKNSEETGMADKSQQLVRSLSVFQGTALAVSLVVGSGVLGLPGIVLEEIGPPYAALAWMLTAVAMIPFIIVFSRLGTFFPSSPGLLSYAEFAFGKGGRNAASLMLLASLAIGLPALLMIGGSFLQALLGVEPKWIPAFAMAILFFSVGFNLKGLKTTAAFNTASVIIVIGFIVLLTALKGKFFLNGISVGIGSFGTLVHGGREGLSSLWKGCALVFWAFLGWENLSFGVQEVKNPERSVPLIFGLSFIIVAMLFLMPAFTSIGAADLGIHSVLGAAGLVSLLEGSFLKPICSLVLLLLILGNANAWVYTASRLLFAEATDGILPRKLGTLSPHHVPVKCLLVCFFAVLMCISVCWMADFKISALILLVNQNFLFLFLASIWAYWKIETSPLRYCVAPMAFLTCSLFLSGFSLWVLFPIVLIVLGFVLHTASKDVRSIPK
jgi:amino acid transporter